MAGGLSVEKLTVGYGGPPVFRDLSLPPFERGGVTALLGPNAAGKSTLLKAIAGLRPARGRLRLGDLDLAALPPVERARRVAYLPQSPASGAALTVYETVLSALRATGSGWFVGAADTAAVESVLAGLGLTDLALREVCALSGGQQQLVALAQAMVRRPEVFLLDEPTSALDLRRQIEVLQLLRDDVRRRDTIAVVALHDINLALRFTDAIVVVADGRVVASGPPRACLDAALLAEVYGVDGRIEACSAGRPMLVVDGRVAAP